MALTIAVEIFQSNPFGTRSTEVKIRLVVRMVVGRTGWLVVWVVCGEC